MKAAQELCSAAAIAVWRWRRGILRDLLLTLVEAFLVFLLSQLPFALLTLQYVQETPGASLNLSTFIFVVSSNVRPGEILAYVASLLASTTVYFILRPTLFRVRTLVSLICTLGPGLVIYFATPTFMADRYNRAVNRDFMTSYAIWLLAVAVLLWTFAMFHQRRLEQPPYVSGDEPVKDIMRNMGAGK